MERQIVVFVLAGEHFGVDIAAVESIITMQTITRIPHSPPFIKGITNLRGKILPIVDLRERFGLPAQETDKNSRIVVVSYNDAETCMIVDEVSEVFMISDETIAAPPTIATTIKSDFITGIVKLQDSLVILLDLNLVLSIQEHPELQEAAI